ncbi:MAG: cytochrome c [Silicimonas sp.]|jgi:mono/diheme cytochrome c family protein|nr:cytochrome c [Silicimonas sp.]
MNRTIAALLTVALTPATACLAQDASVGASLYTQYCSTCHGSDGRGAGPLTEIMTEKPADLTKLAANNPSESGVFPMLKVIHIIDGRTGLRAHGGPMPTYGNIFMAEVEDEMEEMGAVLETRGRILSLAMYLETIQD